MVVDDEEFCLSSMKAIISKAGIDVKSQIDLCITGKEAVTQLKKATQEGLSYRLILTDFSMPELDGIQATKQMREYLHSMGIHNSDQPTIIGITGHSDEWFIALGIEAGMN